MTMRLYKVTLGQAGRSRDVFVPSPTDVQAGDAAAPLMQAGEAILSIQEVSPDDAERIDGDAPKSQAAELAPVTAGAAAAPEPPRGLDQSAPFRPLTEPTSSSQPDAFAPARGETGHSEQHLRQDFEGAAAQDRPGNVDGDPAQLNRGLGQERVGEAGPGPLQRPLDPSAGGAGTGAGSSATPPSEDQRARTPS